MIQTEMQALIDPKSILQDSFDAPKQWRVLDGILITLHTVWMLPGPHNKGFPISWGVW